jgi:hypothetical protein
MRPKKSEKVNIGSICNGIRFWKVVISPFQRKILSSIFFMPQAN